MPTSTIADTEFVYPETDEDIEATLRGLNPEWLPLFDAAIPDDIYRARVDAIKARLGMESLPQGSRYTIREVEIDKGAF